MARGLLCGWLVWMSCVAGAQAPVAHRLPYAPGHSITLSLPAGLDIGVAASGLHRVRFLAQAPDGRIFATGMWNLADNTRGSVFVLEGWDPARHRFGRVGHYLDGLRNPNTVAFYTDPQGQSWIYIPLTDKLIRYRYRAGDEAPQGPPETLIRFPDYGLNYKYGGWHLTRTVAIATLHGRTQVYVSAGSSCNYCQEREVLRAAVVRMDPDGQHQVLVAQGLRNAVDLRFVPDVDGGALFATDMGDDHLGDRLPEDTFFELDSNDRPGPIAGVGEAGKLPPNYGWPTCYFAHGMAVHDTTPLPAMPAPGDMAVEAERPAGTGPASHSRREEGTDSAYGAQAGVAAAGVNLAAGGGREGSVPDPNAQLGVAAAPLSSCEKVPAAYTVFPAHSSPLGLAWFGSDDPAALRDSFLVALHGAGHPHIGTGYKVVRFSPADRMPRPWLTGFLTIVNGRPVIHGRPCGLLRVGPDEFLLTDDFLGLVYAVFPVG